MATFKVWHAKVPNFVADKTTARHAWLNSGYSHVATVECAALGATFELTNHIDHDWRKNEGVIVHGDARHGVRSTSVGDIVTDAENRVWLCEMAGWSEMRFSLQLSDIKL